MPFAGVMPKAPTTSSKADVLSLATAQSHKARWVARSKFAVKYVYCYVRRVCSIGSVAQRLEQWIAAPQVPGSIPGRISLLHYDCVGTEAIVAAHCGITIYGSEPAGP